jgi:carbamoyl-phosphate synthase large subunit
MKDLFKNKRVLVTGSAGVIGLELLKRLTQTGADVLSVDRYPLPPQYAQSVMHVQRDIAAAPLYELHNFQPQIIFHLAAAFERSRETPEFWRINWHDNVLLSHHVVDQAKEVTALESFIFASSYLIYAPALYLFRDLPEDVTYLTEEDAVGPRNITGVAKYYTEHELNFVKEYDNSSLRVVNARIYRVYGCGSRDVISRWVRAALLGQPIQLYNKQNRFDYIFAGDVTEGLLRLASSPTAEGIVNLGSGVAYSIQDVISVLTDYFPDLEVQDMGAREIFEASCAKVMKLKQFTSWKPETTLAQGIAQIIEYERKAHG